MSWTTETDKTAPRFNPEDPMYLKMIRGVRFHHFLNTAGRLIATIATEPTDVDSVNVAASVCASGDAPSRFRGRQISLGRLDVGKCQNIDNETMKQGIRNRGILGYFIDDKLAKRLGYESCGALVADIRPRAEFVRKVAA